MSNLSSHLFANGPARDSRFEVKELWSEMRNLAPDHPEKDVEFLHRQMNEEINSIEMCARNLVDFPGADWNLRMQIARQCWDEARHAEAFRKLLESRGGRVGQYPVMNFQFRILMKVDSLAGRLAVQNRSFEAAGIDAIHEGIESSAKDEEFRALFDAQLADEMQHVRYANEWLKKLIEQGGARTVFALARAVGQANEALTIVSGGQIVFHPVAEELRREAGFTDEEIEAARKTIPSM